VVSSVPSGWMVRRTYPTLAATYTDIGQVFHSQLHVALRRVNSDAVLILWSKAPLSSSGLEEVL